MESGMNMTSFAKLSGQANYGTWAFAMEMFLTDMDLWECIDDDFKLNSVEAMKKDAKARSKICLMCTEKIYPMIMHVKTARDTWLALKRAYADGGLLRRLYLLRKLFNVKLTMFNTIEEYLNDIQTTSQALISIKAGLDDEFVGIIMLAGLTVAFNSLVMTLEHSSIQISTETVMAALMKESMRKESTEDNSPAALMSKSDKTKKVVTCHLCKKKGHYKWQCRDRKPDDSKDTTQGKKDSNAKTAGLITAMSATIGKSEWVIDSGATSHMTSDKHILEDKKSVGAKVVTTANNAKIVSRIKGDVYAMGQSVRFEDVLNVPGLMTNLLSVSTMCSKDFVVVFDKTCCNMFKKKDVTVVGNAFLTAPQKHGLYVLEKETAMVLTSPPDASSSAFDLWHRRLGHLSGPLMEKLKGLADGLTYGAVSTEPCEGCCKGKECVKKFPKRKGKRAKELLELVHSDLAGPMEVDSYGGNKYFLVFVDDFSRKTFVYLLKSKTEVLAKFKEFKALVENQTGKKIKRLRTDNGTEYVNREFGDFLKKHGIQHQTTVPYTPQQNGIAERTIRTITEKARCMIHDAGLSKKLWGEAVGCAVYLKNRSPTMALADKLPEEVFTKERVDLTNLKVFGSRAQVLIKNHSRKKFDAKTTPMVMTGYSENQKGYRFIDLDNNPTKVITARDATFFENVPVMKKKQVVSKNDFVEIDLQNDILGTSRPTTAPELPRLAGPVAVGVPVSRPNVLIDEEVSRPRSSVVHVDVQGGSSSSTNESDSGENFFDSVDLENPVAEDLQGPVNTNIDGPANNVVVPTERRYPVRDRRPKRDEDMVYNCQVAGISDPVSVQDAMKRTSAGSRKGSKSKSHKCDNCWRYTGGLNGTARMFRSKGGRAESTA